jgi:hypothetical protein
MSNKKSVFLFLIALIFAGAIAQSETLTPTYASSIAPGGFEGGLGTIKSGGASVTITATSLLAVSDSATTQSAGSITWAPSVPITMILTFNYQITNPGSNFVIYRADWFDETIGYTDGKVKTFSETFDSYDQIFVSVKAKNGSVSISNLSIRVL